MKMNKERKMRFKSELFEAQEQICFYCGRLMTFEEVSIDHIMPLAKGGTWAKANLTLSHRRCNNLKGCLIIPIHILNDKPHLHKLFQTDKIGTWINDYHHSKKSREKGNILDGYLERV